MDLFGGKLFPKHEARKRLLEPVRQQTALDRQDLKRVLQWMFDKAPGTQTLEWQGDHTISGDWTVRWNCEWVESNGISSILCFGDLTLEGDLQAYGFEPRPLLLVTGDLRVRNLVHGALPLIVLGDLLATGYVVSESNGLLRVGGDLAAAGFIFFNHHDVLEEQIRVVAGSIRARTFEMLEPEIDRRHHRANFVPEVLDDGWLESGLVLEREHAGLPVWKEPPDPVLPPEPPPPMPVISGIDPTSLGTLAGSREVKEGGGWIVSHPFADWVTDDPFRFTMEGQVLILPPGTHLPGDLELEWHADWVQRNDIRCLACEGDLTMDGDLLNLNGDSGPTLVVGGTLRAQNVIAGGSILLVLGDLEASGLVIGHYNHGVLQVAGDLSAQVYFKLDHCQDVYGKIHARVFNEAEVWPRDELVPEVFESEDNTCPDAAYLWARHRAGLPIFKTAAPPA